MSIATPMGVGIAKARRSVSLTAVVTLSFTSIALAGAAWLAVQTYLTETAHHTGIVHFTPVTAAALTKAQREQRIQSLSQGLANNPLDNDLLTDLSVLLGADEKHKVADELATLAAQRSYRNLTAQLLALGVKVRQRDYDAALVTVDALLRVRPDLSDGFFDQLLQMAANPGLRPKVAELLGQNPPWRDRFFSRAYATKADTPTLYNLLVSLKSTAFPPTNLELRGLIGQMINDKDFAGAYYVWLDMLPDEDLKRTGNVFDAGFQTKPKNLYFGWTLNNSKTVEIKNVPRATAGTDYVIRAKFIGNRETVMPIYQYVRLSPGDYALSGEQQSENLKSEAGVNWQLHCVEGAGALLASSPPVMGNSPWARFEAKFTVPSNCTTQILALRPSSNAALDQQLNGTVSFDNVGVTNLNSAGQ